MDSIVDLRDNPMLQRYFREKQIKLLKYILELSKKYPVGVLQCQRCGKLWVDKISSNARVGSTRPEYCTSVEFKRETYWKTVAVLTQQNLDELKKWVVKLGGIQNEHTINE